jgi:hypothetical protein
MVLSAVATRYQLGFSFQAGLVMGVVNTLTAVSICECAMNSACSRGRSAAKSAGKFAGSRNTKPSDVFGRLLVDSGDSDRECGGEHEIARVVATETNFSNDFDVTVRKPEPLLAAYTQERVLETGRVAASEERLRIGCISFAAKFTGQRELHIKQPVLAADMSMTAASCRNFGGIQSAHDSI